MSRHDLIEDLYPLTPLQEGLLFQSLHDAERTVYVRQVAFDITGALDEEAFRRAWEGVIARHPALRTSFAWEGVPKPLQIVRRRCDLPLVTEDWRELDAAARAARLAAYLAADRQQPFDLERAPLLRLALFRTGTETHTFVWAHDHLLLDGWSVPRVFADVVALYTAFTAGIEPSLPAAVPYRAYIAWLRHQDLARAEAYWRRCLAGFDTPTMLDLPVADDVARGVSEHGRVKRDVDAARTARIQAFARRHQLTVNTIVQGAWALLLSRYGTTRDVVFGGVVSGRPVTVPGIEEAVGLFINTLPLRVAVEPDATVVTWLTALQAVQVAQREYEYSPLVRVQRWSDVPAGTPLFDSIIAFQNFPDGEMPEASSQSLRVSIHQLHEQPNYRLNLLVYPGREIELELLHAPSIAPSATTRLLAHLERALEALTGNPDARLAEVTLLDAAERQQVTSGWNATATTVTDDGEPACLATRLAAQAARTPTAVAVALDGGGMLTYAALDAQACQVAQWLRTRGVGREARVGVCAERSLALVVALVGVLKAGAAYVPLDPAYPAARLRALQAEAGVTAVILQAAHAALADTTLADAARADAMIPAAVGGDAIPVLRLDEAGAAVADLPTTPVDAGPAAPEQLAYILFTSGSTGQPKGAMNTHRGIVNRLAWMQAHYALGADDAVLQKTPIGFDVSTWEFFWPLLVGARLVLARPEGHRDPAYLTDVIARAAITTAHFVPPMLRAFLEAGEPARCGTLRRVLCSGEALSRDLLEQAREALPQARLGNLYGPTEAAVDVTVHDCAPGRGAVPIGRPIANTQVYVLGAAHELVPVGVPGELYLGGLQVGRGYVGQPALTAARFVPDPFGLEPGARLYRTGDRARWRADGEVEFLGRLDLQVKIRGYRIEPGEIETALRAQPGVGDAVALVRTDGAGGPGGLGGPDASRLVAYVTPAPGLDAAALDGGALQTALRSQLPAYLVPSAIVALAAWPVTAHGKLDRRALPAPVASAASASSADAAPTTAAETAFARIWREVLQVPAVGVHDNFFQRGGDSILSIQIVTRARQAGWHVTTRQVFEQPTLARLAAVATPTSAASRTTATAAAAGPVALPLTPIQQMFLALDVPTPWHWNLSLLLAGPATLMRTIVQRTVLPVLAQHAILGLRVARTPSGEWTATVPGDPPGPEVITWVDLMALDAAARETTLAAITAQAQRSLSLTAGRPFRVVGIGLGAAGTRLLLVAHHLVMDGVSWRVLLDDLQQAYAQVARGLPVTLPAPTTAFASWATRLAAAADADPFLAEIPYWIASARQAVRSPLADLFGTAIPTARAAVAITETLSGDETRQLLQDVPRVARASMHDLLLTALARVLTAWAGTPQVGIDVEGHGRAELFDDLDLSRTVGWFTTITPMRFDLDGATGTDGALQALQAVKEQRRAVPHHGIGYGLLRYLSPRADARAELAAAPPALVRFEYLGQVDASLPAAGPFQLAPESAGPSTHPDARRFHPLVVRAVVADGRLTLTWEYHAAPGAAAIITRLAQAYRVELGALLAQALEPGAVRYTPSDFPLAGLSQPELDRLFPASASASGAEAAGARVDVEDVYALSPLQHGMLFHTLVEPGGSMYVAQFGFDLDGPLDRDAFTRAWRDLVARHAVLRTRFAWAGVEQPVQIVDRDAALPIVFEDWSDLDEAAQSERLEAYRTADRSRGFDLTQAPLLRLALVRTGRTRHRLLFSLHLIVMDGWSVPLLFRDIVALYHAHVANIAPELPPVPPYRDYVAWLARQDLSRAEAYWRRTLEGFTAPIVLAHGVPQGTVDPGERTQVEARLDDARTARLQQYAARQQITVNTLVQGAWALLLRAYSGERDVLFGVTVSGRPAELPAVEQMVGLLINTLPLRVRVDDSARAAAWLQTLQADQLELREYQYSPLIQVQRWADVPPGTPLFDTLVVFDNYPVHRQDATARPDSIRISPVSQIERTNYAVTLTAALRQATLSLTLQVDSQRIEPGMADQLLDHVLQLLDRLVVNPESRLADLRLRDAQADEETHARLRAAGADSGLLFPARTIPSLFAEQAARTPQAAAVEFGDTVLTYAALQADASALARALRLRGVRPETIVAVCVTRSARLPVALLGILDAGGAYLPLDPDDPPARLQALCADADVRLLVADAPLVARLRELFAGLPIDVVCVEEMLSASSTAAAAVDALATTAPVAALRPEHLAYVIYTSGTTGRPKGVLVPHSAASRLIQAQRAALAFGPGARVLQFAPVSFDTTVAEIFVTLCAGGCLCGASSETLAPGPAMIAFLAARRITNAKFTPSVLAALPVAPLPDLTTLIVGGEACPGELVARWATPARRVVNVYGPTEATVRAAMAVCDPADPVPPIGRPVAEARGYVCDTEGQLQPAGVPGELYIGGSGVARGYLRRARLTAERFLPDPWSGLPGARLYRTGDRVRQRPDGQWTFLGRVDGQVKLRGHRIEPDEIAAVLLEHPAVRETVVIARQTPSGAQLVAYLVAAPGLDVEASAMRAHLAGRLPAYMVPAAFVPLDAIPRTRHGKLHRAALPAPDALAAGPSSAPSTATERTLRAIWQDVLGDEPRGVDDDFFALGGHSLLAIRLMSRVRESFDVEVPLRTLFEAPTIRELAARIDELRSTGARGMLPPIAPAPRTAALPLSFAQQRLWFLAQLDPRSAAYNLPVALRVRGPLDARALRHALAAVVARHEVLRTTFIAAADGAVTQVIAPSSAVALPIVDLSTLAETGRDESARRLARAEAARPFDLQRGPVLRVTLLQLARDEAIGLFTLHHIAGDAWSTDLLVRELSTAYAAARRDGDRHSTPLPLAPLAIQYADYAAWQRQWQDGAALDALLAYWRDQLDGAPAALPLPLDRPRTAATAADDRGGQIMVTFPAPLAAALRTVGRGEGVTLFMTLLAAWQVALRRAGADDDLVIGTPVAGRTRLEIEPLIGFFVNTLVLRTSLGGDPTFRQLLARVRTTVLDAHAHQDVPFERLVDALGIERSLVHAPLFQVFFSFAAAPTGRLRLGEAEIEPLAIDRRPAKFDLQLAMEETGETLTAVFLYRDALFERTTVTRLARHLEHALEQLAATPDARISAAAWLDEAEHARLLAGANSGLSFPARTIPSLFAEQAARTPQLPAVEFGDTVLTYAALRAEASALARALRTRGVRPETIVAVCVTRSARLPVALLGILDAGGAYLPLDPDDPPARLQALCADAEVRLVVTDAPLVARLRDLFAGLPIDVVCVEELLSAASPEAAAVDALATTARRPTDPRMLDSRTMDPETTDPVAAVRPEHLAYVIYTSGTTGRPKGVLVPHGAASRLIQAQRTALPFGPGARVLQFAPLSFDTTVAEIFATLCAGGCLCGASLETLAPGPALIAFLAARRITNAKFTPSVLAALPVAALPDLTTLIVGGEACPGELVARWATPARRVVNVYGPTETTVRAAMAVCDPAEPVPPIGRPVAEARGYVCDTQGQLLPFGVPGELYIGGSGVARGYLRRARLTAERFLPDPWSGVPGARLYRTGDRVRQRPDGQWTFLGRVDDQVQLRGHRIEPDEIAAALTTYSAVREAIVIPLQSAPDAALQLVAFVSAADAVPEPALRAYLRECLPDYMMPARIIVLPALPRTAHGKVDRRALSAPLPEPALSIELPRTAVEELLAAMWGDVLGRSPIGATTSFFALGGHSLLAVRVASRVRQAFGVELPLRAFFEAPTIRELAARIDERRSAGAVTSLPPIAPAPRTAALPLSFAQQRLWFLAQLDPRSAAYNIPVALRLRGGLDARQLRQALSAVVARHEVMRTTFGMTRDGEPMQVIHPPEPVPLPIVDLTALDPAAGERLIAREARAEAARPFDLTRGPMVRATLLRLTPADALGLFTVHHIASDAWSTDLLVRELSTGYQAARPAPASAHAALAPLAVQYADYAAWQRRWLDGAALDDQRAYWRSTLAAAPAVLELPVDRPRPPIATSRGASHALEIPRESIARLRAVSQHEGVTIFMTLLAAWQAVLGRCGAGDDIIVGTPVAGRSRLETEPLIGFFVNTLVLRTSLRGDPTFRELLARVRATVLDAHAHQDLPFERLVESLGVERSLAHTPLFQVFFTCTQTPGAAAALRFDDVEIRGVSGSTGSVKFDLHLDVQDDGERVRGALAYRAELFDHATIARLCRAFVRLLEQFVTDPDARLSAAEVLDPAEHRQVAHTWNDTSRVLGDDVCVQTLIAAQAARTPTAVAVVFEGTPLTYAQLETRADRLASVLRARGIGPEVRVAICAERSLALVVALLAVMKAGGAYVPLDPALPPARRDYMLEDSACRLVIMPSRVRPRVPIEDARVIELDDDGLAIGEAAAVSVASDRAARGPARVTPSNLAYVIYTSGSTGRPKGAMNEHRGIVNRLRWMQQAHPLTPDDVVLQKTPISFDVSTWEFYWPLIAGATLVLARPNGHRDPRYLSDVIADAHITTLHFVPPMLRAFLDGGDPARCGSLRRVICSGEALDRDLVERALDMLPGVALFNLYGPTETAVEVTAHACAHGDGPVPIGRPIANTRMYVLDDGGRVTAPGLPGELFIGGVQVGRGYVGKPSLTAERFEPDDLSPLPGARRYRTGDRARWLSSGELDYRGRVDFQVKIRGYRIEPAEIERVLLEDPRVCEALVVARSDRPEQHRLIAYVAADPEARPAIAELQAHLAERLPEYMVPGAFVLLDRLPLNPNGKVDRGALPAPDLPVSGEEDALAPRDPLELDVVRTCEQILATGPIGMRDNFFARGGNSLLAIRLLVRLEAQTGHRLPVDSVFTGGTPEQLAHAIRTRGGGEAVPGLAPLNPNGARPPLFVLHAAGGDVLCYVPLARRLGDDQPVYGLRARGLWTSEPPRDSLPDMAASYLALVRQVQPHGPYHLAGWSMGGVIALELAIQLNQIGEEVAFLAAIDSQLPSPHRRRALDAAPLLALFARELGVPPERLSGLARELTGPVSRAPLHLLLDLARSHHVVVPDLRLDQLEQMFTVYQANLRALASYSPGAYRGAVTLVVAEHRRERAAASAEEWRRVAHDVELCHTTGDHRTLLREPHVARLGEAIAQRLALARTPRDGDRVPAVASRSRP